MFGRGLKHVCCPGFPNSLDTKCRALNKTGGMGNSTGAFPSGFFDELRRRRNIWSFTGRARWSSESRPRKNT